MKKLILIGALLLSSVVMATPAWSVTWNDVKDYRKSSKDMYFMGVWDTYLTLIATYPETMVNMICMSEGVTYEQLSEVAIAHLNKHSEQWHFQVSAIALAVWIKVWPCPLKPD